MSRGKERVRARIGLDGPAYSSPNPNPSSNPSPNPNQVEVGASTDPSGPPTAGSWALRAWDLESDSTPCGSMVKVQSGLLCPSSAPVPPQGTPGGSWRPATAAGARASRLQSRPFPRLRPSRCGGVLTLHADTAATPLAGKRVRGVRIHTRTDYEPAGAWEHLPTEP